jgi:hypothetical protein
MGAEAKREFGREALDKRWQLPQAAPAMRQWTTATRLLWFLAAVLPLAATAHAANSTTASTTSVASAPAMQTSDDDSTPLGMLRASDALNGAEPAAFARFYHATNDDERRMARTEARFDSEFGLLQLLVEKKWGKDAGDAITHAMDGETIPDAEAAALAVDGDQATLTWKDNSAPLHLIKVGGRWRIDLAATLRSLNITAEQYIDGFQKMGSMVADFAESIDTGKLTTLAEAVADAKRRTASLSQSGD